METGRGEILGGRRQLLEMVQVAFVITDAHAKILYANRHAGRLFGYAKEEMVGKRIRSLFLEEDQTYFFPNIIYLTVNENGFDGEVLLRRKDGTRIFVRLASHSFKEGGERFLTFSLQEIQRLKELERERREMGGWVTLGKMVEEIAHQVRNPVVSIGGYTKRLKKTLSASRKGRYYLEQILHQTGRLETLILRVEEYVLIPRPVFQRENIQEVIETALGMLSKEATAGGISLSLEMRALKGAGNLFIDKGLVIKALGHILRNSMEALAAGPKEKGRMTVDVALWGTDESIGISISDKGEGISPKNLTRIFDPFFSSRPDHVGLGLTVAKKMIEGNMGRIDAESRLRRGMKITITFPRDRRRQVRRASIIPSKNS